ncbi:translation elongation factor Tu [Hypoxylon texense]
MVSYRMIAVAGFLASVNALPLNINLGAYSPALVVGDGEISFGGGQDVTNLMNALEGAAVNAASGTTNNAAATENAAAVPAVSADTTPVEVVAAQEETPEVATPAETTATQVDPNLEQQAQQISGLQGMGKEIAPREDAESPKAKRDLAGFDRALTFAEAALTKGPTIQLGTGEGGAGVGIIVDNNGGTVGEAAAAAAKVKRDESSQPRRRTKVTRMYVKRGVPAAIQTSSEFEARSVESLPVAKVPAVAKRSTVSSDVIDSINLNVNDDQGFTMTFVETTEDDDAATDELDE